MTNSLICLAHLADADLLTEVHRLAAAERQTTAALIASLMELDARRLYLGQGCSSLFTYCTQVLHFSEHAAYGRIEAARAARRFPMILDLLADGSLTLTAVGLLAPHLTAENHPDVLAAARHQSKRDVEHLVARLRPQPAAPSTVRKLPAPRQMAVPSAVPPDSTGLMDGPGSSTPSIPQRPARSTVVRPLAPERYKIQVTVSRETYEKLRRAQDLLRHTIPSGDPAVIVDRALTVLVADLERRKLAATDRPRAARATAPRGRHIPAAVKRAVWKRDEAQCAFVGTNGRCRETAFLEVHHRVPYAAGGRAVVDNLELRCAAHNAYEAQQYFGARHPALSDAENCTSSEDEGPSLVRETPGLLCRTDVSSVRTEVFSP